MKNVHPHIAGMEPIPRGLVLHSQLTSVLVTLESARGMQAEFIPQ